MLNAYKRSTASDGTNTSLIGLSALAKHVAFRIIWRADIVPTYQVLGCQVDITLLFD